MFSQGVPMLSHGDELGRTQRGNNNGYCQDNELTWIDWDLSKEDAAHLEFTRRVVQMRKDHATLRRRRFFRGAASHGGESDLGDIAWFTPDAEHMTDEAWNTSFARSVMVFLNGDRILEPGPRGERIVDDSLLILLNADTSPLGFVLPPSDYGDDLVGRAGHQRAPQDRNRRPGGRRDQAGGPQRGGAVPAVDGRLIHGCQRAPSRAPGHVCRSRPTGSNSARTCPSTTSGSGSTTTRPSGSPTCTCRRSCRPRRDPPTATTSSTTRASARSWAGGRHSSGWRDAAHARGLGIIVDVVPNHMAIPTPEYHNRAFWSVLAEGRDSPYASWFDVDWAAANGRRPDAHPRGDDRGGPGGRAAVAGQDRHPGPR